MRKWIGSLCLVSMSLLAMPKAIVFDFGNVLASPDKDYMVRFLSKTFQIEEGEFDSVNKEKHQAMKNGESETGFWIQYGKRKGIALDENWDEQFHAEVKASLCANEDVYELVEELKKKELKVGLLSNITESLAKKIRPHGLYDPFDPCLLSCELGIEKPDPKIYQMLLDEIELPAEQIVFVDDLAENIEAAKKMGIDGITFVSAKQLRDELQLRGLL